MLATYRNALALPGAPGFTIAGFAARFPIAMIGLGIVLMVSTLTGSYALAGVLSASFQVSAALGAIYTSRWADRLGQARLLVPLSIIHALGLLALVAAVQFGAPIAIQVLAGAVAGLAQPAIGSMVRARWANAATDVTSLRSGFALESILDELIFTVGPMLTALLAFSIGLAWPLVIAAVLAVAGMWSLAALRTSQPPVHRDRDHHGSALRVSGLIVVVLAAVGVGAVFGSYEVAVVAFTREAGIPGASGLVLGLWALGSMVGGIIYGSRTIRATLPRQAIVVTGLAAVVLVPVSFLTAVPALSTVTLIGGMTIAPCLIVIFTLTERLVPDALLTEGLTWTNSGMALGFSGGNLLAGIIVDSLGTTWAFRLPLATALFALAAFSLGYRTLRAHAVHDRRSSAPIAWNDDPVPGAP